MIKLNHKINRRRFLKEGLFLGILASLYPLLRMNKKVKVSQDSPNPRKARHWRRLAG